MTNLYQVSDDDDAPLQIFLIVLLLLRFKASANTHTHSKSHTTTGTDLANSDRHWERVELLVECDQHAGLDGRRQAVQQVVTLTQDYCRKLYMIELNNVTLGLKLKNLCA